MRAEVGLLTRNILISGETTDEDDRFGGHIKAFRGFRDFRRGPRDYLDVSLLNIFGKNVPIRSFKKW